MMTIKLKSLFIALLATIISLTTTAKLHAMTIEQAEQQIAKAGVGICLQTINHHPLNSFNKLATTNLKNACPNFKLLVDQIDALKKVAPGKTEIESINEQKVKTGYSPIDRCLKKTSEDITNWSLFIEHVFNKGNYVTGDLSLAVAEFKIEKRMIKEEYVFAPAHYEIYSRLQEYLDDDLKDGKSIIDNFKQKCNQATQAEDPQEIQAAIQQVNNEWNSLCGIDPNEFYQADGENKKIEHALDLHYITKIGNVTLSEIKDETNCNYEMEYKGKLKDEGSPPYRPFNHDSYVEVSFQPKFCFPGHHETSNPDLLSFFKGEDPAFCGIDDQTSLITAEDGSVGIGNCQLMGIQIKLSENEILTINELQLNYNSLDEIMSLDPGLNGKEPSVLLSKIKFSYEITERAIRKCVAMAALTVNRYKKEGNIDLETTRLQPNVSTFDNKITCMDTVAQAIDYKGCANFVEEYNYSELVRVGEQTASEVITKNAQLEAQLNMDPNDPAYLLRQQLRVVEGEKTAAFWAQWAHYARFLALESFALYEFPSADKLVTNCVDALNPGLTNDGVYVHDEIILKKTVPIMLDNKSLCDEAMTGLTLFPNKDAANKAHGLAIQAIAEGGIKTAQVLTSNRNIDLLNDAIENVDEATEATETPEFFQELKLGPCATNPESEECVSAGFNTGVSMVNPTINTGTTVQGTGAGELVDVEDATDSSAVTNSEDESELASTVSGSTFTDRAGSGGLKGTLGAARMVSGAKVGAGGAGAGGGASASTGAANGGNRGASANTGSVSAARKLKFNDSDSSRLGFSGGKGVGSGGNSRSKKRGNPLAALMGKKGGAKTQRYARGTASLGKKGGNIFDQISTRYKDVNGKKRLMEYVPK